jgi:arsenate reductase
VQQAGVGEDLGQVGLIGGAGVGQRDRAQRVFYLDNPPARGEITRVLALLGTADPRTLMRTAEPRYRELGLAEATPDELIDAMTRYPELIQRPVVIWADRAVIARPPELLLPLLETGPDPASP